MPVDHKTPLFFLTFHGSDKWREGRWHGGNYRSCVDHFSVIKDHGISRARYDSCAQLQRDTSFTQNLLSILGQFRSHFRQNTVAGMDQHHGDVFLIQRAEILHRTAQKIIQFGSHFHSGKPGTADDKAEQLFTEHVIFFNGRFFQRFKRAIAQAKSVTQCSKGQSIFG